MSGSLPSLGGLRAFEVTARLGSATLAAAELHVTPGAVSLRIRELEAWLGVALFTRRPRKLSLTPAGKRYAAAIRPAFHLLGEATREMLAERQGSRLVVGCTPGFAVQWLVPRLSRFEAVAPDVEIRISASNRIADFAPDGVDFAIRHGFGRYEGLVAERLVDDELVPVCRPDLGGMADPSALATATLLHDEHRHDWRLWLDAAGLADLDHRQGPVFTDGNGAIDAAKSGLGVALVRRSLVTRELAEGVLVAPFPQGLASALAYFLVYPPGRPERPAATLFRRWLLEEAGRVPGGPVHKAGGGA